MDLGIENKVALISGGTRGIGFAIAERLLREGVNVAIVGRSQQSLEDALARLEAIRAGAAIAISTDMTDASGIEQAVATTRARFGPIQIAVSNVIGHVIDTDAAGPHAGFFAQIGAGNYQTEFKQLALSAWLLAQAVLPDMKKSGWGRILNIGSMVAREPMWELPHVLPNVVRPAVAGLYRSLAREVAASGITVNSLLTGSIATERNRDYFTWLAAERGVDCDEMLTEMYAQGPIRRPGLPDEMATLATFFCSQQAAAISGQSIHVNGGRSRHLY